MVAVFALVRLRNPALAVLAALATGLGLAFGLGLAELPGAGAGAAAARVALRRAWRWDVLIGLGVPLYLVTMASQNLPGFATLRAGGL